MGKTYTEILAASEATILKRDDIQVLTQDGQSKGIRYSLIQYTIYAHVVNSQTDFNAIIERVAANQYKIKDGIYALTFKPLTGGYKMYGGTSPLSGGDTWGYIETNQCTKIYFDPGAYIDVGLTIGYMRFNTPFSIIDNPYIKGDDTGAAAAIVQSFLFAADNVTLRGAITTNRYSNVDYYAIKGSTTYKNNLVSLCKIHTIKNTTNWIYGIHSVIHVNNCSVYDITSASSFVSGIEVCDDVIGCNIYNITADILFGIQSAKVRGCEVADLTGTSAAIGIKGNEITNCKASIVVNGGGGGYGFGETDRIIGCHALTCDNGFDNCEQAGYNFAQSNTGNGFNACIAMGHNKSTGNGTNYNNCFADFAGTVPVADTAAGGYNG